MKLAVTHENGQIFQHFGHSKQFKIYDFAEKKIIATSVVDVQGTGHGALADFLKSLSVEVLICGGIGDGAKAKLADAGIQLFGGVSGSADAAVEDYLAGTLAFNPDVACKSHDHEHSHTCGGHHHEHGHAHTCSGNHHEHGHAHTCSGNHHS